MWKTQTDLLLKTEGNIPIEIVSTASAWQEILLNNLPFIITIVIISVAAIVTYRSNRKSIESQNDIASKNRQENHENKISEFRHSWIQEVRETGSELIQVIHECQYFTQVNNHSHNKAKNVKNEVSELILKRDMKEMGDSFDKMISKRAEFYRKEAKLRLLFKKGDADTVALFEIIESAKSKIGLPEVDSLDDTVIQNITNELQIVLKNEWEVTKNRTWLKTLNKSNATGTI